MELFRKNSVYPFQMAGHSFIKLGSPVKPLAQWRFAHFKLSQSDTCQHPGITDFQHGGTTTIAESGHPFKTKRLIIGLPGIIKNKFKPLIRNNHPVLRAPELAIITFHTDGTNTGKAP